MIFLKILFFDEFLDFGESCIAERLEEIGGSSRITMLELGDLDAFDLLFLAEILSELTDLSFLLFLLFLDDLLELLLEELLDLSFFHLSVCISWSKVCT